LIAVTKERDVVHLAHVDLQKSITLTYSLSCWFI